MITTMNPELVAEDIREDISRYTLLYYKRPTALVIGEVYLHFLRAWAHHHCRLIVGELDTFEGLTIVKTKKDVCEVF